MSIYSNQTARYLMWLLSYYEKCKPGVQLTSY